MKKLTIILSVIIVSGLFSLSGCDLIKDKNDPGTPHENTGDTLWIHTVPKGDKTLWIAEIPLAVGTDGTIYYSASGGMANWEPSRIYAVNKNDGTLKWQTEPLELWHVNSNIVVADDGTVYILSYTKLYSIDPASGIFNWVWEVPQTLPHPDYPNGAYSYGEVSSLALAENGDLIFKTSGSGVYFRALYCVGTDGNMKWFRFIQASGNPITIGYNGIVYDYSGENNINYLMASDPATGGVLWKIKAYTGYGYTNITVADNGDLIAFLANDSLARINPADGSLIWKSIVKSSNKKILIDHDGLITMYDQFSGIHRYSSQNGSESGQVLSIPESSCIDGFGKMYSVRADGFDVYKNDGTKDWSFNGAVYGKSLVISSDHVVYAAAGDKVYAIRGDASLAMSGWPAYAHDSRNTFNFNKH